MSDIRPRKGNAQRYAPTKGISYGKDSLGRLYKTVNGKHVTVGEGAAERKEEKHHPHTKAASEMLRGIFAEAKTPEDIRQSVEELLQNERFWSWFTSPSSEPTARLYVAKVLLSKLRETLQTPSP